MLTESVSVFMKPLLLGSHSTNLTFNDIQDWCQLPSEEVIMSKKLDPKKVTLTEPRTHLVHKRCTKKVTLEVWKIIWFLKSAHEHTLSRSKGKLKKWC